MSDLIMLDDIRYPQRSKVDVRSVKSIHSVVALSTRLIYMMNVLKLSIIVNILSADRTLILSKVGSICKTLYQ